jgi:hypothetical protein
MATLVAIRHNPVIQKFNAMIRDNKSWQAPA